MTSIGSDLLTMQNATSAMQAEQSKETMGSSTLSKDSFLRLMIEQLKNQDPLNPSDNSQMLQQQATLTQVESMQNLENAMTSMNSLSLASSMIGKAVTVHNPDDETQTYTGTVQAAVNGSDGASVVIDGVHFPIELVDAISDTYAEAEEVEE